MAHMIFDDFGDQAIERSTASDERLQHRRTSLFRLHCPLGCVKLTTDAANTEEQLAAFLRDVGHADLYTIGGMVYHPALEEDTSRARHDEADHRQAANRAVAVSAVGLALTGGIELALALFTGSVALLGDALHNLADVSTSAVVFLGFRISRRPPSRTHPYGYERAEDLAGLGIALVIWASAVFAGYESYQKFVSRAGTAHAAIGMLAAVLGMAGNFAVSRYKAHVARRIQSVTMAAEAKHSWLDVISSLGALVGLIGVALGYRWADPLAGCAVTLFICQVGYEVTAQVVHHLMDGVDPDQLSAAEEAVRRLPGVRQARVRGRWMGRSLVLDIEGELAGDMRLAEAEGMARQVQDAVHAAVEEARNVCWIPRHRIG
jgi:cation diffusion facilitator family transporter